jgi:hypothetical protein
MHRKAEIASASEIAVLAPLLSMLHFGTSGCGVAFLQYSRATHQGRDLLEGICREKVNASKSL